jgi:hypothetical protein
MLRSGWHIGFNSLATILANILFQACRVSGWEMPAE